VASIVIKPKQNEDVVELRQFIVALGTIFLWGALLCAGMKSIDVIWPIENKVSVEYTIKFEEPVVVGEDQ
jgi:hypothetical protein